MCLPESVCRKGFFHPAHIFSRVGYHLIAQIAAISIYADKHRFLQHCSCATKRIPEIIVRFCTRQVNHNLRKLRRKHSHESVALRSSAVALSVRIDILSATTFSDYQISVHVLSYNNFNFCLRPAEFIIMRGRSGQRSGFIRN